MNFTRFICMILLLMVSHLKAVNSLETNFGKVCGDELDDCVKLVEKELCTMKLVQMKCKSTCGLCAPSPPIKCELTKYGCCWDNFTKANSSNKDGCPACIDKFDECKYFKDECVKAEREDIRLMCPITCGIKCDQCRDSEHQKRMCPQYKEFNLCKISPDLMKQICARSCNFCPAPF